MKEVNFLTLNNINKSYQEKSVLKNINFSLKSGKTTVLLGQNGAGKTTLFRILLQLTKPDSGEIYINNKKLEAKNLHQFGYLPEERGLYPDMEIEKQLFYLARLHGLSTQKIQENLKFWLDALEISNWKNKKIKEVSKGMAQKIQFLVAILHDPICIFLDEPWSGLDPLTAEILQKNIDYLKQQNKTILLSSHDLTKAYTCADEFLVLKKGEIIAEISKKNFKNKDIFLEDFFKNLHQDAK